MRHRAEVTFGGSQLDRAAELRGDPDRIGALLREGWVLPIWRGKPLVNAAAGLGWLRHDSPVLARALPPVFLGLDAGIGRFSQDVSHWSPLLDPAEMAGGFLDPGRQNHPALDPQLAFEDLRNVMAALSPLEAELAATAKAVSQWHRSHGFCASCGAASEVVKAGWQRHCPACGNQHFPRTDPVVIMLVQSKDQLLLGRSAGWPEGMYSLLAGFVEPGETLEGAVRREVAEETGIAISRVTYLASQPWPFPTSLMLGCLADASTEALTIDRDELEDALWVSREDVVRMLAGTHPTIKTGRKGAIAHFLITNWLADRLE